MYRKFKSNLLVELNNEFPAEINKYRSLFSFYNQNQKQEWNKKAKFFQRFSSKIYI